MKVHALRSRLLLSMLICTIGPIHARAATSETRMLVTMLGTGTPYPDAGHFGSAILVEAGEKKLLFDCGRGVVIRLAQTGIRPNQIDGLFLTHLHSDHIVGIPDFWLTGWFLGRDTPLRLWGPVGTRDLAEHLTQAFASDLRIRESTEDLPAKGAEMNVQEIQPSTVYHEAGIQVSAFVVDHGPVKPAFGYRVEYAGHSLVISGDTKFSQDLINAAKHVDCLIHVAWSVGSANPTPPSLRSLASAEDAARVFTLVQPRLAVVYHYKDSRGLAQAIAAGYRGRFIIAQDLTQIMIGRDINLHDRHLVESTH